MDIAGLVKGASKGEGLGNKFRANIRECAAIVHVVRCFNGENVIHVEGSTDPIRDMDIIDLELIMADVEMADRRIDKARKAAKADKKFNHEAEVFEGLRDWLNDDKSARSYLAEVDEDGFADPTGVPYYDQVSQRAAAEGAQVIPVCAKLEAEIAGAARR